jgi:transposase-like protein
LAGPLARPGLTGLIPRYPQRRKRRISPEVIELIAEARREFRYGASRTRLWLMRVHEVKVATKTITSICSELGLRSIHPPRRRRGPRQLKLFERPHPGDCVQVDVKVVKVARRKCFQYTALDDCTRLRVLRLYRRQHQLSSLEFLGEVQRGFPFPIHRLQTDNGSEFPLAFALAVQKAGIRHRYIQPRPPEQNGKVERSHRIDAEKFWSRHDFESFDEAPVALQGWHEVYNRFRFSMALHGKTRLRNSRPCSQRPEHHEPPTLRPLNRSKPGSRSLLRRTKTLHL